jgi:hypothetical protein
MDRLIAEDGTRTHKLNATEASALRKAVVIVDEVAFIHRDTLYGQAVDSVRKQLESLQAGEPLVGEPLAEIVDDPAEAGGAGQ